MITRPVFVRRLKTLENGEFSIDPEGEIGEVVSKDLVPVPDPTSETGHSLGLMLTIEWENTKHPALDLVPAALLENVSDLMVDDEDEDGAENEDDGEEYDDPSDELEGPTIPS